MVSPLSIGLSSMTAGELIPVFMAAAGRVPSRGDHRMNGPESEQTRTLANFSLGVACLEDCHKDSGSPAGGGRAAPGFGRRRI